MKVNLFRLFWERELFTILPAVPRRDERRSIPLTGSEGVVRCLLLTANAADKKKNTTLSPKAYQCFETSTQKTDRRHTTPFPNTNEAEGMPTTSLHNLLDSMHNTLRQLQIAAERH